MNHDRIRRLVIIAVCADDELSELLVLKGGNALALVHEIGQRASLDVDFSIPEDLPDPISAGERLKASLSTQFETEGFVVFDFKIEPRPRAQSTTADPTWGGYRVTFKLFDGEAGAEWLSDIEEMRRRAFPVNAAKNKRDFKLEISKFEYCEGKETVIFESFDLQVYTPAMIADEKLRALCQQRGDDAHVKNPRPRARDFYDIWAICENGVYLASPANLETIREMFRVKDVPLIALDALSGSREFYRQDWPAVRDTLGGRVEEFDFYFDFVIRIADELKAAGIV